MSYLEYSVKSAPTGLRKVLYLNWGLAFCSPPWPRSGS
jgi:rod shape determining protein RodA